MSLILALVGYSSCIGQVCCNGVCVSTSIYVRACTCIVHVCTERRNAVWWVIFQRVLFFRYFKGTFQK